MVREFPERCRCLFRFFVDSVVHDTVLEEFLQLFCSCPTFVGKRWTVDSVFGSGAHCMAAGERSLSLVGRCCAAAGNLGELSCLLVGNVLGASYSKVIGRTPHCSSTFDRDVGVYVTPSRLTGSTDSYSSLIPRFFPIVWIVGFRLAASAAVLWRCSISSWRSMCRYT